jgi:hypothetical protein
MTQGVIDIFESVEIENYERQWPRSLPFQECIEIGLEAGTVWQTSELIEMG